MGCPDAQKKISVQVGNYGVFLVVAPSASLFHSPRLFVAFFPLSHISHHCYSLNVVREWSSVVRNRMVVRVQNWTRNTLYPTPYTFGEGTRGKAYVFIKELFVQDTRFLARSRCWLRFGSVTKSIVKRIRIRIFTHSSGGCTLLSHDTSKHQIPGVLIEFIRGKSGGRMAK